MFMQHKQRSEDAWGGGGERRGGGGGGGGERRGALTEFGRKVLMRLVDLRLHNQ